MENKIEKKVPTEEDIKEAMMLYPLYLEDIKDGKARQWQLMVFFFSLQGALIQIQEKILIDKMLVSFIITISIFFAILYYGYYMSRSRERKESLREYFSESIKSSVFKLPQEKKNCCSNCCVKFVSENIMTILFLFLIVVIQWIIYKNVL